MANIDMKKLSEFREIDLNKINNVDEEINKINKDIITIHRNI